MSELAVISHPRRRGPGALQEQIEAMIEAGFSASCLAVEAGLSTRELDAWRECRGNEDTNAKLAAWLAEREKAIAETGPGFVQTPTARRIFAAFDDARSDRCIALIYGGAGVGKTQAARHYLEMERRDSPYVGRVHYITCGVAARTPTAVLELLAEAMGCYGNAYRLQGLAEGISRRLREGDLLIVDEAQFLEGDSLDLLRGFLPDGDDDFGVGIAYIGNGELYARLHGAGRAARFAQITSRVGAKVNAESPSEGDVDALLAAWGVSGRKEREFAVQLGTVSGGLRVLGRVLRKARMLAQQLSRPVDVKILKAVARRTGDWRG